MKLLILERFTIFLICILIILLFVVLQISPQEKEDDNITSFERDTAYIAELRRVYLQHPIIVNPPKPDKDISSNSQKKPDEPKIITESLEGETDVIDEREEPIEIPPSYDIQFQLDKLKRSFNTEKIIVNLSGVNASFSMSENDSTSLVVKISYADKFLNNEDSKFENIANCLFGMLESYRTTTSVLIRNFDLSKKRYSFLIKISLSGNFDINEEDLSKKYEKTLRSIFKKKGFRKTFYKVSFSKYDNIPERSEVEIKFIGYSILVKR